MAKSYRDHRHHILLGFFDSHEHYRHSDKECQEFAKDCLKDFCFLYEDSEHEDEGVRRSGCHPVLVSDNKMIFDRNGRGTFVAPWLSRHSLRTSRLLKAHRRFLISTALMKKPLQPSVP